MKISIKEKIKYWFYFLQLAYQSEDKDVRKNLNSKKMQDFYKPWGDVRKVKNFSEWWKNHSHLFMDKSLKTEILKDGTFSVENDYFYVRIPYHSSPTQVGSMIKRMYSEEKEKMYPTQTLRDGNKQGRKKLTKKDYKGQYSLTTESEYHENTYRVDKMKEYFAFAKFVYMKLINQDISSREKQTVWRKETLKVFGCYDYEELITRKRNDKFRGKFGKEFGKWWSENYREFQIKNDNDLKKYEKDTKNKLNDWEDKKHWCYIRDKRYRTSTSEIQHYGLKKNMVGQLPNFVLGDCFYEVDNTKIDRIKKDKHYTGDQEQTVDLYRTKQKKYFKDYVPLQSKKVENDNRTIREFRTTVEKILLNVSKGEFPGDYVQNRGKKK